MADHDPEGGGPRPADLLEEARDPQSPLHALFTWDEKEAAERYRQAQEKA